MADLGAHQARTQPRRGPAPRPPAPVGWHAWTPQGPRAGATANTNTSVGGGRPLEPRARRQRSAARGGPQDGGVGVRGRPDAPTGPGGAAGGAGRVRRAGVEVEAALEREVRVGDPTGHTRKTRERPASESSTFPTGLRVFSWSPFPSPSGRGGRLGRTTVPQVHEGWASVRNCTSNLPPPFSGRRRLSDDARKNFLRLGPSETRDA